MYDLILCSYLALMFELSTFIGNSCILHVWSIRLGKAHYMGFNRWYGSKLCNFREARGTMLCSCNHLLFKLEHCIHLQLISLSIHCISCYLGDSRTIPSSNWSFYHEGRSRVGPLYFSDGYNCNCLIFIVWFDNGRSVMPTTSWYSLSDLQSMEKYTHGVGRSVFLLEKSLEINLQGGAWKRIY